MARERKVTANRMLMVSAVVPGGLALGLSAVDLPVPVFAPIVLGLVAMTAACLLGIRYAIARVDWFDCGYRAGWADAAHEFCPYPAQQTPQQRVVVPMRRQP